MRDLYWILALALIAFGGSLGAPFHLDDFALAQDPAVTWPDGWIACFSPSQTRPLTWLTFWANFQLGGTNPTGYHAVNLLLHLANIALVWTVLRRLAPAAAATIATVIFALHPLQTEAVTYVFARATLLMTLFCLLSLRDWTIQRHGRAIAWFALALLAKEECVTYPLVLALLHLSISRDVRERKPIAAMLALSAVLGARVLWATAVTQGSGAGAQSGIAPLDYFSVQGAAILRYLRLLFWPHGFSFESPLTVAAQWWAWLPIAISAYVATRRFDKAREGFWWLSALLILAPSSSILPAMDLSADRRTYFALAAMGAVIGLWWHRQSRWIAIGLGLALTALSTIQSQTWRDPKALWRQAIAEAPRKVRPHIQLARQLAPSEALALLSEAQSFAPNDANLASEKGRIQLESGNPQLALGEFGRALALAPDDARMVNNRGVALTRLGQTEVAKMDFERALRMEPCFFDALWNLRRLGYAHQPDPRCRFTASQRRSLNESP
ncbi:MAG: glycosyltransferase family 39 protein [Bryobacterales bacterium]|nr:glycosyltransferase family 39 protein [Bryobacterales bacterium]